jgi:hypothetical protein
MLFSDIKSLEQFLELVSFYPRFLPGVARVVQLCAVHILG